MRRGVTDNGTEYVWDRIGRQYGIQEEGPCGYCGMPLELGDGAYMLETGDIFCGMECLERVYPPAPEPRDRYAD